MSVASSRQPPSRGASSVTSRSSRPASQESDRTLGSSNVDEEDAQSISSLVASPTPSVSSRGSRKKKPSRTNARSLDPAIHKQVLQDAEDAGGLFKIASEHQGIPQFCRRQADSKEEIYGHDNSKEREKIVNKLRAWVRGSELDYEECLADFGITPFKFRNNTVKPGPTPAKPPATVSLPSSSVSKVSKQEPKAKKSTPVDFTTYREPSIDFEEEVIEKPTSGSSRVSKMSSSRGTQMISTIERVSGIIHRE